MDQNNTNSEGSKNHQLEQGEKSTQQTPEKSHQDRRERYENSQNFNSVDQLFGSYLSNRAARADQKLRINLTGIIQFKVKCNGNTHKVFIIDWHSESFSCQQINQDTNSQQPTSNPDCVIEIRESDLLKIAQSDLNPQIAMLSDKVKVQGKLALAVYFFNLIADSDY